MDCLCGHQTHRLTLLDNTGEKAAEHIFAPPLSDTGQRGMIWQGFMKRIADKPADRQIDLSVAHEPPVLDDAKHKPGKHQPHGNFRIHAGSSVVCTVKLRNLARQPAQVKDSINPYQHMLIRDQIAERPSDEQFDLTSLLPTQHDTLNRRYAK